MEADNNKLLQAFFNAILAIFLHYFHVLTYFPPHRSFPFFPWLLATLFEEHKNMPLEDALALIHKDFEHYSMSVKEGRAPARKPPVSGDISQLLGKAASGGALSSGELSTVISALQKQKGRDESDGPHHGTLGGRGSLWRFLAFVYFSSRGYLHGCCCVMCHFVCLCLSVSLSQTCTTLTRSPTQLKLSSANKLTYRPKSSACWAPVQ